MRGHLHYTEIGAQAYRNGNYRVAGRMFLKACKEAEHDNASDPSELIGCYYNLALFYHQQNRHRKAEITLVRALNLSKDQLTLDLEVKAVLLLIDAQKSLGSYRKALKILRRLIQRINAENKTTCWASFLPVIDRLISLYMLTNNEVLALKWCREAIASETAGQCPESRLHANDLSLRLAWIYSSQGLTDHASRVINSRSRNSATPTTEAERHGCF